MFTEIKVKYKYRALSTRRFGSRNKIVENCFQDFKSNKYIPKIILSKV